MRMGGLNGNGKGGDTTPKRIKPKGNLRSRWLAVLSLRAYPLLLVVLSVVLLSRALSRPRQHSAYQLSVDLSNAAFSEGIGGGRGSIPLQPKPWRHLTKPLAQILRPKRPLSPPPPPPSASEDRILHSSYAGTDQDDLDHPPKHFVPLTKEELVALVGRDPKFLIRDNHATYGYNNVRYIFENTLLWGKVMNRIPVIPDAVWGRTCAVESEVCNQFAMEHYTNRTEAAERIGITSNFWNEDGEVWKLGIDLFLDLTHLRKTYGPVLTMSEFFTLHDLDPAHLPSSGHFDPLSLRPLSSDSPTLKVAIFPPSQFEPSFFIRIDEGLPREKDPDLGPELDLVKLFMKEQRKRVFNVEEARFNHGRMERGELPKDEKGFVKGMKGIGLVPVWTFSDRVVMNKALSLPTVEFARPSHLLSLSSITSPSSKYAKSSVLYFPGEFHDQRKPGDIRFRTKEARDEFARTIVESVGPPEGVVRLGRRLARRMARRTGGRRWMAAHMRRGDFINIDWSPYADPKKHFQKTKQELRLGTNKLRRNYPAAELPLFDDPFYLATDENSTTTLHQYHSSGALLLSDLLVPSDLALLGWCANYGDILALVEQQLLSHADYFVGSEMSSTTGGTINLRKRWGKPNWSWGLLGRDVDADREKQRIREQMEREEMAEKIRGDKEKEMEEEGELVTPLIGPLEEGVEAVKEAGKGEGEAEVEDEIEEEREREEDEPAAGRRPGDLK